MHSQCKITMVQFTPNQTDGAILERMEPFFEQAVDYGSDLIAFPEYTLGNRIPIEHPDVQGFLELTRKYKMYSVVGLVESHGERWATTALMVDRQGRNPWALPQNPSGIRTAPALLASAPRSR